MRLRAGPVVALVLVLAVVAAGVETWRVLTPPPALREGPRVVDIPAHEGVVSIAQRLEDGGAVRSAFGAVAVTLARGSVRSLKAGEYEVPRGASTLDVIRLLESGRVRRHPIL